MTPKQLHELPSYQNTTRGLPTQPGEDPRDRPVLAGDRPRLHLVAPAPEDGVDFCERCHRWHAGDCADRIER